MINPASDPADVGQYWSKSPYTGLKKLRLKYLCVPPTTVFREWLFSNAGCIKDCKHNRLDLKRVKMLVFFFILKIVVKRRFYILG